MDVLKKKKKNQTKKETKAVFILEHFFSFSSTRAASLFYTFRGLKCALHQAGTARKLNNS